MSALMSGAIPLGPKPGGYYEQGRANLIAELPRPLGRVLDVGCGEGGVSDGLRAAGAEWISGIEILPEPAAKAAAKYDEVELGDAIEALDRVSGPFDTILCYDVIEHLVDPGALLRRLRDVSRPGARLHVSTPNARHFSLVRDLVLRGTFGYREYGHRDSTHLRWFTLRDLRELLEDGGWRAESATPSALHWLRMRGLDPRLLRLLPTEFVTASWYVLARAPSSG
jgi:SAM-dependent methyltransferase